MISCTIRKQSNDKFTVELRERYLVFFSKTTILKNLTENEVQKIKIPWCDIIRENGISSYICPQRMKLAN